MDDKRIMLKHFLGALAYRTQKALRDAPPEFAEFRAAPKVRTPHELILHMDSVLGYARTYFIGGSYQTPALPGFDAAILHFQEFSQTSRSISFRRPSFKTSPPKFFCRGRFPMR